VQGLAFNTLLYTSAFSWLPSRPLSAVLGALAEIGYDGVEIAAAQPHAYPHYLTAGDRAAIRRETRRFDLGVPAICSCPGGAPGLNPASPNRREREAHVAYVRGCIELASDLECELVVWLGGWVQYGQPRPEAFALAASCLRECADIAEPLGVRLAVEAPAEVANLLENVGDARRLLEAADVGTARGGVLVDTLPLLFKDDDLNAALAEAGERLVHVHLQDRDSLPPGARTDFRSFLAELRRREYGGWLTVEAAYARREPDPDGIAWAAFDYLSPLLTRAGAA